MAVYLFSVFLGLHLQHVEAPRGGVESELSHQLASQPLRPTPQLMATPDP